MLFFYMYLRTCTCGYVLADMYLACTCCVHLQTGRHVLAVHAVDMYSCLVKQSSLAQTCVAWNVQPTVSTVSSSELLASRRRSKSSWGARCALAKLSEPTRPPWVMRVAHEEFTARWSTLAVRSLWVNRVLPRVLWQTCKQAQGALRL